VRKGKQKQKKLCNYKECDVCNLNGEQRTHYLLGEMVSLLLIYKKELLDDSRGRHALKHIANYLNEEGGLMCAGVVRHLEKKGFLERERK
jgi:hypothetical protein